MDYIEFFKKDNFATEAGVKLTEIRAGYAKATLTIEEKHLNAGGVAQGGAIFTLADLTMAAAANAHGIISFSIQCNIRFLLSARCGDTLTAETTEILNHKTISHYTVHITNQEGDLIAILDGICYKKR